MKSLLKFYLKNFKVIHHSFFILLVFSTFKLFTFVPGFFGQIFQLVLSHNILGFCFQIAILVYCFKVNPIMLEKAGLTDDYMQEQLENLDKKNSK